MIKNVVGYEGKYAITDDGIVYNLQKGNEMKQIIDKNGYVKVSLYDGQTHKQYRVHRLVYHAFMGELHEELVIDHIDGNKHNNNINNLRQITSRENTSIAKTHKVSRGVTFVGRLNKYKAEITIENVKYYLGLFIDAKSASNAYNNALENYENNGTKPYVSDKTTKLCKCCGRILPKSDFYFVKTHGVSYLCKDCHKEKAKEYRQVNIK